MEQETTRVVRRRLSEEDIELKAAAVVQARKAKEKEDDINELITALKKIRERCGAFGITYDAAIRIALGKSDRTVACIARFHQNNTLQQYINELIVLKNTEQSVDFSGVKRLSEIPYALLLTPRLGATEKANDASAQAVISREAAEEKEKDKKDLLDALAILADRTSQDYTLVQNVGWPPVSAVKYSYPQIIEFALSDKADDKVACIARLHREGKLKQTIEDLQKENKVAGIPHLIKDVLAASDRMTAAATTPASSYVSFGSAPRSVFYSPAVSHAGLAGNKSNLGGTLGLGLGLFAAGGLGIAIGILMIIGKIATVSAGASSPLPPLAIPLLVVGGAALLASLIILAALAYKYAEKGNRFETFTNAASATFKF